MCGARVTSALSANRASFSASRTIKGSDWRIAWAQNATSRGVSCSFKPSFDLNHCLDSSTREIIAMGTSHT